MKRHNLAFATIAFLALFGRPAVADDSCSVKNIAGNWIFATSIGRQMLGGSLPPDKDITAIGTMNIARDGTLSGTFDFAVENAFFFPGVSYSGSVMVNPDCTGRLIFQTSFGSTRTDSIAIVSGREILAMSQDPQNLWTYQIRRIAANLTSNGRDDD